MTSTKRAIKRQPLTIDDIKVGKVYRGNRPIKRWGEIVNDRVVLRITPMGYVQYDSNVVRVGRHYPVVGITEFLRWASHEVMEEA
jgi:hypothetical protein